MEHLFTTVISEFHLKRYLKFVSSFKENELQDNIYCENHHILPKKVYPEYKKDKWNIVRLPYRAHYLAHYMLAKAIGGNMWFAFNSMNNKNKSKLNKLSSILYKLGKENFRVQKKKFNDTVDEETGLTNAILVGRKVKRSKLEKNPNIYFETSAKSAKTMTSTILENGETIAQKRARDASKTSRERRSLSGFNSANTNVVCIYDNFGKLRMISFGNLRKFMKRNNLPRKQFEKSIVEKTIVIVVEKSKYYSYNGWSVVRFCKLRDFRWVEKKLTFSFS